MAELTGIPSRNQNEADALGQRTAESEARSVLEFHRRGLSARRQQILTHEKYAIHLDGEGDGQWADIFRGSRVEIPQAFPGEIRHTENLLRPIVDNAVAYHTTMPFRFVADAKPDREARQRAIIDQALINHMATHQRWNRVFAEAMQFAMVAGSCPVHAFWRDDLTSDPYEPIGMSQGIYPGFIDAFVGDPYDTVYNPGARRNSVHMVTYGRTVPLEVVVSAFGHMPGVDSLKGSKKMPSASRFQRILRQWSLQGLSVHGSATIQTSRDTEELIALISREIAPGMDPDFPDGRITLVAVQGSASVDTSEGHGSGSGAFLLHDGPLPARRFSMVRVYSANRFDDIYGKPFVGDLDDLQVQLNRGLSMREEFIQRSIRPVLVTSGTIIEDTAQWVPDGRMEIDVASQFQPYLLSPAADVATLNKHIEECRNAMFTLGGYQAASRGEANAGDAAAKVIALAKADDTIHGPTNQRFRESVEEYGQLCHGLFREFADIPWLIDVSGKELGHLVEPWVDRTMVSPEDPMLRLTSGFGATIEAKANQMLQFVQTRGADGMPLLDTISFQANYPDASMYPEQDSPREIRLRRARTINARIRMLAKELETKAPDGAATHPLILLRAHTDLTDEFPMYADDDLQAHFDALSSIIQDENESKTARELARYRQAMYQYQLMTGMPPAPADPGALMAQAGQAPPAAPLGPQESVEEAPATPGGTTTAAAIAPDEGEVAALTAEAQGNGL